jgi:pimeloyl-ACP methyl ester carboxylesterase
MVKSARGRQGLILVLVVAGALVAGACGTTVPPTGAPSPSTTTLPRSFVVANSGVGGPFSGVGPVYRVAVVRLGRNRIAPRQATGQFLSHTVLVAYRRFGSGPNLLLINGEHSTMTSWDPSFLFDLAAHFTVTEFDFPDVGYSAPDDRYASVAALGDYTAGLIWALGLDKPTVLGWGFGGEVALSLVERHPGLIWRLVLADATPGGSAAAEPSPAVAESLASPLDTPTELSYVEFPVDADAARATWLSDTSKVTADVMTAAAVVHEAKVVAEGYLSDVVAKHLDAVGIPTLIFQGGRDIVVPPANAYTLDAFLAHARLVMFGESGYGSLFEDTRTVVGDLESFVSG